MPSAASFRHALLGTALLLACAGAMSAPLYFNGFETDLADSASTNWQGGGVARVASGTGGIASSDGGFHAVSTGTGTFGRWGGYNYGAGGGVATTFQPYTTSIDIYLDVTGGWGNDTRFDFSSAINNASGNFLRDFIFNGGFYNDATGPGGGTERFVISASNNAQPGSAFAKNPARNPIAIDTSGWYTFQHAFYDNGGQLAVDMVIMDAGDNLVGSWTLSDPADLIAGVGGNRYGWFNYHQFSTLAFDNATLTLDAAGTVPVPASALLLGLGLLALRASRRGAR